MERLSRIERKKIIGFLQRREEELEALLSTRKFGIAYCMIDVKEYELLIRKYRLMYCYMHFREWKLIEPSINFTLPDTKDIFYKYHREGKEKKDNCDEYYQCGYNTADWLAESLEIFLSKCLEPTGWKIHTIHDITDYEQFDEEMINSMRDIIETHWYYMNIANEYYDSEDGEFETESKYLEKLGLEPNEYTEVFPYCNLILTNSKIKEMLKICNQENKYKEWDEYKELKEMLCYSLIERKFGDLVHDDFFTANWTHISYLLGATQSRGYTEESSIYQLNVEMIAYLILADMAADDFLEKYHFKKAVIC